MFAIDNVLNIIILIGIAGIYIFKDYLFSYSSEKAKNLATKEDIGIITRKVESVKVEYLIEIEELKAVILETTHQKNSVWLIKRDACLKALDLANAILSNYQYNGIARGDITREEVSIKSIRSCFNELACSCESSEVIDQLKTILFDDDITVDAIVDMRNAVRKELGFGDEPIDLDRDKAFIFSIGFGS